jgi:hypothetical protein
VAEPLRLMVHSVYSETDIFLRELISNASDACDRLRYEAIAQPTCWRTTAGSRIRIRPSPRHGWHASPSWTTASAWTAGNRSANPARWPVRGPAPLSWLTEAAKDKEVRGTATR